MTRLVAFDESGNTGADLLNVDQPTFVLASCDFTVEEADALLNVVDDRRVHEIKLSKIKKSPRGRQRILQFLNDERLTIERAKVFYFHKRYMTLTKIVDLLVENLAYRDGIDLYKDGGNIALSNLHYYCIPTFCGEVLFEQMLGAFVRMFRERTDASINSFYETTLMLQSQCRDTNYKEMFIPIIASIEIIHDVLCGNDITALDPAIPAFFTHGSIWGQQYGAGFKVLHDESKPIARERESLEWLMNEKGPFQMIGYDRRTFEFPLRTDRIEFCDSRTDSRLQVADLISGSCNHWARGKAEDRYQDEFWQELDHLDMIKLAVGVIWPSPEVTPNSMGTDGGGGSNPVDEMTRYLSERHN